MSKRNLLLSTDSYKLSHRFQYPAGTSHVSSYVESRGGEDESLFFGLQAFLKDIQGAVITKEDVDEFAEVAEMHGEPAYREQFDHIVNFHGGRLPIEIRAVAEGTVMPTKNVQLVVENTDPFLWSLTSYLETALLRAIWYPSTVATESRKYKKLIADGLRKTSDVPVEAQISFKLHDFGARGASSGETAMLGGMAHLVNFMGTDTVEALVGARRYYGENMAGFSIPASEHSTMTSWGRENESKAYENMIELFSGEGKLYACVSDSYDIYNAVRNIWGEELIDKVKNSGGTLVVRPDSGDPTEVPLAVIEILMEKFGFTTNSKGFKVLPACVRVIQGDGITSETLPIIIDKMIARGLSLDNLAFGMGGGLLQNVNRDTLKYAMKTSAVKVDGVWRDVYKDPVGGGKTSKKGRLALVKEAGYGLKPYIRTVPEEYIWETGAKDLLVPVFRNGEILVEQSFAEIRERANEGVL